MSTELEPFVAAFRAVSSGQSLNSFIELYGLTEDGLDQRQGPRSQVYRVVGGTVANATVKLTHRWHDPSQAFSVKSDISKVDLEIDGRHVPAPWSGRSD